MQPIYDWIMTNLMGTAVMVGMLVEFIFRMTPTNKAWSLVLMAKEVFHMVAEVFAKVDEYLSKVIPQNLK